MCLADLGVRKGNTFLFTFCARLTEIDDKMRQSSMGTLALFSAECPSELPVVSLDKEKLF